MPVGRYQHAAVCVPTLHAMYVFGGLGTSGAVAEMWKYNLDSSRWSKLQVGSEDHCTEIKSSLGQFGDHNRELLKKFHY